MAGTQRIFKNQLRKLIVRKPYRSSTSLPHSVSQRIDWKIRKSVVNQLFTSACNAAAASRGAELRGGLHAESAGAETMIRVDKIHADTAPVLEIYLYSPFVLRVCGGSEGWIRAFSLWLWRELSDEISLFSDTGSCCWRPRTPLSTVSRGAMWEGRSVVGLSRSSSHRTFPWFVMVGSKSWTAV